jgi:sentrin-specific protease 1
MGELDITRHNFECMRDGKWLNDEARHSAVSAAAWASHARAARPRAQLINFYLGLLQVRELGLNAKKPRVHFHNTFFYNKLYADNRDYSYKAVARWTSEKKLGYSILDCDLVVVPVHQARRAALRLACGMRAPADGCARAQDVHWVLAVCDLQQHEIRYYDSLGGVDQSCLVRAGYRVRSLLCCGNADPCRVLCTRRTSRATSRTRRSTSARRR